MLMTALSIAAHLFLVWLRGSYSITEILGPIYFFAIVAHQCFFYGARLAAKAQQAADPSAPGWSWGWASASTSSSVSPRS